MKHSRGYARLHRKLFDHPLWKEERVFSKAEAWIDIVFARARALPNGDGLTRGEFQAAHRELAKDWQWEMSKVRRFIGYLLEEEMIAVRSEAGKDRTATVYAVLNFDKYQLGNGAPSNEHHAKTPTKSRFDTVRDTVTDTVRDTVKSVTGAALTGAIDTVRDTVTDTVRDTPSYKEEINVLEECLKSSNSTSSFPVDSAPPKKPDDVERRPAILSALEQRDQIAITAIANHYALSPERAAHVFHVGQIRHGICKPDDPIRSVKFYAGLVDELRSAPLTPTYLQYLPAKLRELREGRAPPG